jgi:ABC-type transporter Mla MlaB component
VTVRISVEETNHRRLVRVEGRLTVDELSELEGALGDDATCVELDLQNLRSADGAGLAALRRLRAAGVGLRAVPPRIAFEIEDEG